MKLYVVLHNSERKFMSIYRKDAMGSLPTIANQRTLQGLKSTTAAGSLNFGHSHFVFQQNRECETHTQI